MISHHHKAIFVHIPKCAGQSIETAFLDDLGLSWKNRAPLLLRPNPDPKLGPPRLAHLLASEYVKFKYISQEQFNHYYKFSVIRSPISRLISTYNYLRSARGSGGFGLTFEEFLHEWLPAQFTLAGDYSELDNKYEGEYHFVRPQFDYLTGEDGELLVNQFFMLEDMSTSYSVIKLKCMLEAELKHINAPQEKVIRAKDLKPRDIKLIKKLYRLDFKLIDNSEI